MLFHKMFGPQIVFGSAGGSSGGGGGGSNKSSSNKSTSGGKGSSSSAPTTSIRPKARPAPKAAPKSKGRNMDADMFAGSTYSKQSDGSYKSPTSVSNKDLQSGNVTEFKSKTGTGSIVVARGTNFNDVPQVGSKPNSEVYNSTAVGSPAPTAPVTGGGDGGSSAPVTAPETIDPADGVGGGRDGGGSARRKQSKTSEDKVTVKRKAEGVKNYKTAKAKKGANNPMTIKNART